ncbi:MAG: LysR family transcriptional regulator [bacterium]|nr:LysR family transcriptional regulator [bacterium]
MKIWLISGASSYIGKTTLLNKLAAVLPDVESMKTGHHAKKNHGAANYFISTDDSLRFIDSLKEKSGYLLVESNRLAGIVDADLVIFLDSMEGDRRRDANTLHSHADIILGHRGNPEEWNRQIKKLKLPKKVHEEVLDIFKSQHEFLSKSRVKLKTKIWLGRDGNVVFGEGLARLLDGIDTLGSLSKAAKEEEISYRHAWGDIKRAEERLGFQLLERNIGGKSGGGSQLTPKARDLLAAYFSLKRKAILESDRWFRDLFSGIIDDI